MEFRILGPLEVADGSRLNLIAGARQRSLLAFLLLRRNEVVAFDLLLEELWGEQAYASAQNALQAAVSRLRRALPQDRLVTESGGYLLRLARDELDAERFEQLLGDGRAALSAEDAHKAAELLRLSLSLWRGAALADFLYEPFAQTEIARLEDLRLDALQARIDADLALGRHAELVAELEALVADHPLRERMRGQLMLALYWSGRQADALEVYRATRTMLLDELGLEPGPELRELERRILAQDPALELPAAPPPVAPAPVAPPPAAVPETRKMVTVLFCDLAGSTALTERLDPEILRDLLGAYAAAASEVVSAHGGTMEKFIGDAAMAIFGVPTLHEDDALRAVRAAVDLCDRIAALAHAFDLDLCARIGIETGEVVAGDDRSGHVLATGAPVTTAARLEQQASPGEILLGEATRRLVAASVRLEPLGMLALNGKRERLSAWRLIELLPEAPPFARRLETPLVGRRGELAQLRQTLVRAARERSSRLFTVYGPAGIGKTRLARELAAAVADEASVLVGRCPSYGEEITFWPLREILRQTPDSKLRTRVTALLGADDREGSPLVATTDEIFVAARRLLESLARERPLVLVLEDLHWADPTFLDFVEYLAQRATDAPMLLLCLARPELLELHDTWGGGFENASFLRLEPLADAETELLLDALQASSEARAPVKEVAEGNPLFVEQMLAWLEETDGVGHERTLPPTIQAVLAARLDRLGPGEAAVLHRAAVIGRDFASDAVLELLPAEGRAPASRHLDALVRKSLVRPVGSELDVGGRFRFTHALVQDAAYRMVPKRVRAELHERFAEWLEHAADDHAAEYDEIVGYHFAQAHDYRSEREGDSDHTRYLARKSAERLSAAGRRSLEREDHPAAVQLLGRALDLLPEADPMRRGLLPPFGSALAALGQVERAEALLSEAIEEAARAGDRLAETWARIEREGVRTFSTPGPFTTQRPEANRALEVFEQAGDERGLARAWDLLAWVELASGRLSASEDAYRRCIEHARRAGDAGLEIEALRRLAQIATMGPTPVDEGVMRCERILKLVAGRPIAEGSALTELGVLRAMQGRFDEARALLKQGREVLRDAGAEMSVAWASIRMGRAELLSGDAVSAERELRPAFEALDRFGNTNDLAFAALWLAEAMCAQGRYEEAVELTSRAEDDDQIGAFTQVVRARALAGLGQLEEAEHVAREAAEFLDRTEVVVNRARAHLALAEILRASGRAPEAADHADEALRLLEQKGAVSLAHSARDLVAELAAPAAAS